MRLGILVLASSSILFALPPPIPGGGVIERQIEKEYESKPLELEKELPPVQIDIPEERLEIPEGVSVRIDSVCLEGNESFSCEEIQQWIACCIGKELNLCDIYSICSIIDAEYAKRGYIVARAYPPPQSIQKGCLTIRIIEGKVGRVEVRGNRFYKDEFIQSYFSKLLGKPLNYNKFMRALLLLNEHDDLHVGGILSKGKEIGTVDIILPVEDHWPGHLYFNGNNYGRKLTTSWRAGGRLDVGSLLAYGDKFSLAQVVGFPLNALYFTDVIYSIPIGRNGFYFSLSYLFSKFKVEQDLYLHLKGNSNIGTVKVSQAIIRDRTMSLDFASWFDVTQIENLELGQIASFDKLRVLRASTTWDRFASANSRDYLNFQLSVGIPYLFGGMSPVDSQCSRTGAGGQFVKFYLDYDRLQKLSWRDTFFMFHFSGQWSPYRLAIPEQLYLGGADTVRGYPLAAALGDSGYWGNLELHIPPPVLADLRFFMAKAKFREVCQLVAFIDQGGVFLRGGSSVFELGAGIGFRLNHLKGLSLSLDVGFPLIHNHLSTGAFTYIKVTGCPF